ncbi:hydrolase activity protein [[Candida] boidinii]|nr:hydrolase activity protein [[Candida] boidinii]OWB63911.1 hydrolase activity protein [[Candida] boidinii]OWB75178.1 hydrolase activity protein [[Candida] boidinii]OWB80741.1 hydrolase activity protein [[Candida] boidinii]
MCPPNRHYSPYTEDGGQIRLTISPEIDSSCFTQITSFFFSRFNNKSNNDNNDNEKYYRDDESYTENNDNKQLISNVFEDRLNEKFYQDSSNNNNNISKFDRSGIYSPCCSSSASSTYNNDDYEYNENDYCHGFNTMRNIDDFNEKISPNNNTTTTNANNLTKQNTNISSLVYSDSSSVSTVENTLLRDFQFKSKQNQLNSEFLTSNKKFDSSKRLNELRKLMWKNKIGVYIIPSEDEHQSEYTASKDQRRSFISGFTGSAGIAVVTLDKDGSNFELNDFKGEAALSTDGRYFLQATNQLDDNWVLLKQGIKGDLGWQDWALSKSLVSKYRSVSVDPKLISNSSGNFLKEKCHSLNVEFLPTMDNLIDKVMNFEKFKPILPNDNSIYPFEIKYSGEDSNSKINKLRNYIQRQHSFAIIISALDDIAWLLNLRGNDIEYNPVFFSYIILTLNGIYLYTDKSKFTNETTRYLSSIKGLTIKNYKNFWDDLPGLETNDPTMKKIKLPKTSSYALNLVVPSIYDIEYDSIVVEMKGIKNDVEIEGHRFAQLKDGIALTRFFAWLQDSLINENLQIDELQASERCEFYRSILSDYKGLSFDTISSSGKNASIIHYSPTIEDFSIINPEKIYLCDSGAQYLDGTTDITRTVHYMEPTKEEIKAYTLVLKGHLQIAMARFPLGTDSSVLDFLAREPLYLEGMNYKHGTGHGIGTFLCVHEGPCGIGSNAYGYKPLVPGNIISDEPGYYKDNEFGIRIESDILVIKSEKRSDDEEENDSFLEFEYLTKLPFCRKLIDLNLLNKDQIKWINEYYLNLRYEIIPQLEKLNDKRAIDWLLNETNPF